MSNDRLTMSADCLSVKSIHALTHLGSHLVFSCAVRLLFSTSQITFVLISYHAGIVFPPAVVFFCHHDTACTTLDHHLFNLSNGLVRPSFGDGLA